MSQPASPQMSPRKGKYIACRVYLLDDTTHTFPVPHKALGRVLFDDVARKLSIIESDYFDLEYLDYQENYCWLDHEKPILKQVSINNLHFKFLVKFYTPDPGLLEDEYTRYLFALQIKRDLCTAAMPCQEHTAVLLASYIVQSEIGDFVEDEYIDQSYLANLKLLPNQTDELDIKIMEHHREHIGQSPAEADFNLLDTARKVELYGIRMHSAKDHEGVSLHLATAHMGVLVFQSYTKINTFSWAKVRKLSFKRKKFLIKLHPEGYGYYKDTVEFYFESRNECKNFWKKCIEHHAFFRCHAVKRLPRNKTRVVSRGSSFRYSGKTQKQLVEYVRDHYVKRPPFERTSTSLRTMSSTLPRGATINSRHNTSSSAGSHTLTRSHDQLDHNQAAAPPQYLEKADVHNGTASGAPVNLATAAPMTTAPTTGLQYAEKSPRASHIDPSKFMLSADDRKMSAPVLPMPLPDEEMLRSQEVENIPDRLRYPEDEQRSPGLTRTQSATQPDHHTVHAPVRFMARTGALQEEEDEELPPPPPPIYNEEHPQEAASVTLTLGSSRGTEESEEEGRRKRYPADKAYYIAKELLMTERTYRKDLEVITIWLRDLVAQNVEVTHEPVLQLLFSSLQPIYDFHTTLLKDIETRLHMWEGKSNAHLNGEYQRIGDIMLNGIRVLQLYSTYIEAHEDILTDLEMTCKRNRMFELMLREFEAKKMCYLPLHTFLLKPAQRLLHYQLILERLQNHYSVDSADFQDCQVALSKIQELTRAFSELIKHVENLQKLIELQRDLIGIDSLVQSSRKFIREGCLQKLSKKGYQQRMFFLFSDMLVYTSRTATPALQFKVHGQLMLRGMIVDETDAKMGVSNSFTIYSGNRCLVVAASSEEENSKWQEDLRLAISLANDSNDEPPPKVQYPSLKSNSSSEALEESHDDTQSRDRGVQHRANTTMHVCWHRNTSVSMKDHNTAIQNQLSGYLLRKFKNSNGWQKLWVVFTNFCLFFYKTYQDDFPLASLPLLGYAVTTPSEVDDIHKDYVFKLQFKNHVYFFRAESQYTFDRWVEVISSATSASHRTRTFSRLESSPMC